MSLQIDLLDLSCYDTSKCLRQKGVDLEAENLDEYNQNHLDKLHTKRFFINQTFTFSKRLTEGSRCWRCSNTRWWRMGRHAAVDSPLMLHETFPTCFHFSCSFCFRFLTFIINLFFFFLSPDKTVTPVSSSSVRWRKPWNVKCLTACARVDDFIHWSAAKEH